jgi:hypothetical protein
MISCINCTILKISFLTKIEPKKLKMNQKPIEKDKNCHKIAKNKKGQN